MQRIPSRIARRSALTLSVVAGIILTTAAPATATEADTQIAASSSALERVMRSQRGAIMPGARAITISVPTAAHFPERSTVRVMPGRDAPDVFGSVALPVRRTPLDARWRRVAGGAPGRLGDAATRLLASLRSLPVAAQAERINRWVNTRVSFTPEHAGKDHWASATETLRNRRGDCEDYAVAKMQMLRSAGVSAGSMYFVVVYDLVRRQDHAVLVVRTPNDLLLLDSDTDRVADATLRADYRPMLSFSGDRAWVHGYAQGTSGTRYAANGSAEGTPS